MWSWLALIGAPLLTLGNLGAALALVGPGCAHPSESALHALHAVTLTLCLLLLVLAGRETFVPSRARGDDGDAATAEHFVSSVAVPAAALSTLMTLAQWASVWMLAPCAA